MTVQELRELLDEMEPHWRILDHRERPVIVELTEERACGESFCMIELTDPRRLPRSMPKPEPNWEV